MKTLILSTLVTLITVVAASIALAQPGMMGAQPGMMGAYPAMGQPMPSYGMTGYSGASQAQFMSPPGYQPVQFASHCDSSGCAGCDSCGSGTVYGTDCSAGGCGDMPGAGCGPSGCGLLGGGLFGGETGLLGHGIGDHKFGGCGSHCFGHENESMGGRCLPRWFDFSVEWLYWDRDFSESQVFSTEGIGNRQTALSGSDLEIDNELGVRVTGAYLVAPATALEVSYFGGFNFTSSAAATSDGNLFSVFSDFGTDPLNGFPETDRADFHSLALSSELDSGELNLRHRWVSANCLVHSSWLVGARYVRVAEDLIHDTQVGDGFGANTAGGLNYVLKTDNDLVGAQIGTDAMICITPRFKIGGEVEAGVYGSRSKQRTDVISFQQTVDVQGQPVVTTNRLTEFETATDVSFVGEVGLTGLFRITPRLTLKAGYQVLYIAGVAEAFDNFNTASPLSARASFIDNDGDLFYHGSNLGFEWTW